MEGRTAGGSRNFLSHLQNPHFPFSVCDDSATSSGTVVRIKLHQRRPETDLHPIGFHIYKVRGILVLCAVLVFDYFLIFCFHSIKSWRQLLLHTISLTVATHSMLWKVYCIDNSALLCVQIQSERTVLSDQDLVASCVPHCYTQDVSLALRLPPGSYSVVPSTYQPDCSADFTLSVARRVHRSAMFLYLDCYWTTVGLITDTWLFQESGKKPGEAGANHPRGQFMDQCDIY